MTIGIEFSTSRLRKRKIFCINPTKVNVAGRVKVCCFDKTGTLTEDSLRLTGLQLIKTMNNLGERLKPVFTDSYPNAEGLLNIETPEKSFGLKMNGYDYPPHRAMLEIMASTHSIGILDGKFVGDPLDIEMLEGTGFDYNTEQENSHFLVEAIIKPSE
jgi:cation-transporting ATPase 13A2